jgi:hypothetical protein
VCTNREPKVGYVRGKKSAAGIPSIDKRIAQPFPEEGTPNITRWESDFSVKP